MYLLYIIDNVCNLQSSFDTERSELSLTEEVREYVLEEIRASQRWTNMDQSLASDISYGGYLCLDLSPSIMKSWL